ncbi:MAG: DUF937 domain-containing protein [Tenacibaculum sp.]
MAGILDLLNSNLGKTIISGVASSTGQNTNKTANVLNMALPVLVKAMQRNASTSEGAKGLQKALSNKHDGSILDNLGSLFKGGVDSDVLQDGSKIVGHVLGNKQKGVEQIISQKSGVEASAVGSIIKTAAPVLMGFLGKQNKENNSGNIGNLLGGLLGGDSSKKEQNFFEQILDADGDGSIVDDLADMVLGSGRQKSSKNGILGGVLGGLFGKK